MAELKPEPSSKSGNKKSEARNQHASPDASSAAAAAAGAAMAAAPPANDEAAAPVVYKVNESILARWVTGDKAFYPARIMSVTGSATAPMYTVKFKSYDTIETLRARDIRPIAPIAPASSSHSNNASLSATGAKRKAEGSAEVAESKSAAAPSGSSTPLSPATSTPPPPPPPPSGPPSSWPPPPSSITTSSSYSHAQPPPPPPPPPPPASTAIPPPSRFRTIDRFSQGVVSSASPQLYTQPAQLYQQQQQQQQQQQRTGALPSNVGASASSAAPLDAEEPPVKKFKKIKATKQLEAGKSKWQEFSSKGKTGKPGTKKDSMFRTPEGIHGRGMSVSSTIVS